MPDKRLFIAVDLSDPARNAIFRVCRELPEYRWTKQEQLHLTLRFIGDIDTSIIPGLCASLSEIKFNNFELIMTGTGFFRPSIFFLALEQSESLNSLKGKVDSVLTDVTGMPVETREFVPHITLTRFKRRQNRQKLERLESAFAPVFPIRFEVDSMTLYASELTPRGAIHTVEGIFKAD